LGVEFCDVSALQAQNKITGQSRQILFEWLPPQTQDLHGFFRRPEETCMKTGLVARLTIVVCLLAAAAEAVLGCTSTTRVSLGDAPIVLFIVGPYLLIALVAWLQRGKLAASWTLLAVAVGLSAWGLHVFVEDSYRYQTEPHYRKVQRMAVFFVPLLQWALVLLVGTTLLVWHQSSLDTSPAISAEQSGQPEPQMTSDLES